MFSLNNYYFNRDGYFKDQIDQQAPRIEVPDTRLKDDPLTIEHIFKIKRKCSYNGEFPII